ncbi:acyl-CoA dehydrogenase family protein [Promicromonospora sp. NPDC057138]|uniref:acyl-CoA dehydrogenase family protein n=1 Tax=Promicromonospora sp. NPDC057138 TaxID=3346031 RepID=UPI0036410AF3
MLDDLFSTPERRSLRDTVRTFVEKEAAPHLADWGARGEVPRKLHRRAGELGLLGVGLPEQYGSNVLTTVGRLLADPAEALALA